MTSRTRHEQRGGHGRDIRGDRAVRSRCSDTPCVGILHGCLRHHVNYDETIAWQTHTKKCEPAAA